MVNLVKSTKILNPQGTKQKESRELIPDLTLTGCTEEEVLRELARFKAVPLEKLDNHTGVLHVWLLVLEGLASTVSTCPKNYQPQTLEVLFELLRSAAQTPGESEVPSVHTPTH